jgi:hypothetical protein
MSLYKKIGFVSLFFIVLLLLFFLYLNNRSYELKINFNNDIRPQVIKVYKASQPEPLKEVMGPEYKTQLPKGEYLIFVEETDKTKEYTTNFNIDKNSTLDINLIYRRDYLDKLLQPQEDEIKKIIERTVVLPAGYKINDGSLLGSPEWYGTTLSVGSPRQLKIDEKYADIYRVIVGKEKGVWRVRTLPPEIIISNITYKDIPKDVINLANLIPVDINDKEQTRWQSEW